MGMKFEAENFFVIVVKVGGRRGMASDGLVSVLFLLLLGLGQAAGAEGLASL